MAEITTCYSGARDRWIVEVDGIDEAFEEIRDRAVAVLVGQLRRPVLNVVRNGDIQGFLHFFYAQFLGQLCA